MVVRDQSDTGLYHTAQALDVYQPIPEPKYISVLKREVFYFVSGGQVTPDTNTTSSCLFCQLVSRYEYQLPKI